MSEFRATSKTFLFCMRWYGRQIEDLIQVLNPLTHTGEMLVEFLCTQDMHHGMINLRHNWIRQVYTKPYWNDADNWDILWNESEALKRLAQSILGNEALYDWIFCYGVAREKGGLGERLIWDGFTLLSRDFYLVPLEREDL